MFFTSLFAQVIIPNTLPVEPVSGIYYYMPENFTDYNIANSACMDGKFTDLPQQLNCFIKRVKLDYAPGQNITTIGVAVKLYRQNNPGTTLEQVKDVILSIPRTANGVGTELVSTTRSRAILTNLELSQHQSFKFNSFADSLYPNDDLKYLLEERPPGKFPRFACRVSCGGYAGPFDQDNPLA